MPPSALRQTNGISNGTTNGYTNGHRERELNLSIVGLGVEYPPFRHGPDAVETLAKRFYNDKRCPALEKVLSINRFTGIETRASIGTVDHPVVNQPNAPSILELNTVFREEGVKLSVAACQKAVKEWGGDVKDITHVIATTCTNSANPGFDHFVVKELGLRSDAEKVLLHGIGCSGGLAAIRTAVNLALGHSFQHKPARILTFACEVSTVLVRSELDSICQNNEVRIGACLFSDCASSCIVSNGIGDSGSSRPVYEILGWKHKTLEDTHHDLGFDVDPLGWKVVLSPRVPSLASASIQPAFRDLLTSLPQYHDGTIPQSAPEYDWALHPGGSTILTGVGKAMNLTPEHMRASYEVYMEYGNSSSATIMSVMDRLRRSEGKEDVIATAFGPGMSLEMMVLKRRDRMPELPFEPVD